MLPEVKYVTVFVLFMTSVSSSMCLTARKFPHTRTIQKISHCCHVSNRHTQHLVSNADAIQAQVYDLSPILNFIYTGIISYRKTTSAATSTVHKTWSQLPLHISWKSFDVIIIITTNSVHCLFRI